MDFMAKSEVVALRGNAAVERAQFHRDVMRLTTQLPETGLAINLCEDRYAFMVGFCAALYRGQTTELPSSRAVEALRSLSMQEGRYFIVDAPGQAPEEGRALMWNRPRVTEGSGLPVDERFGVQMVAANLYTSGTTGQPAAHGKRWDRLARSARLTGKALNLEPSAPGCIVSCVPAQHMFGFEMSIMLPLVWGCAFDSARPFFPQDIADALARAPGPRYLVATPLHLKGCVQAGMDFPRCERVITATAPLSRELAVAAEQTFDCPVVDIYGTTESGVAAMRCAAREERWQLLEGYRLIRQAEKWFLRLPHDPAPIAVADRFEVVDPDGFILTGRSGDLIKVGGKRASLAELNRRLLTIEGVEDGVIFMPDGQSGENRPAALVVAPSLDERAIHKGLSAQIDPVFIPRPILLVDQLPRTETGKLPRSALLCVFESRRKRKGAVA